MHPIAVLGLLGLAACQTAPRAEADFLTRYEGLTQRDGTIRASVRERRDDAAATAIERVWIEPAALVGEAGQALTGAEREAVRREVERQACYEVSERFTVVPTRETAAGRLRLGVTHIAPTGRVGGAAAAAANYFIPGPLGVRVPGTTGGLAAEAELLGPSGDQVAALAWARNATVVGTDDPSLSRVGDAHQLAEPFADALGDAIAPTSRRRRPPGRPDPCAAYGPRFSPAGFAAGMATGLYVPELTGARPQDPDAE
jgi:hypothetical protein